MYYFGSGPASLPEEVLREAAARIIRHGEKELSVLEIPHRGRIFQELILESEGMVKSLLKLSDDYDICWMHGGGRTQFGLIPMNFLGKNDVAGFMDTGHWARNAQYYASFYGKTLLLASSEKSNYDHIPECKAIPDNLTYLHLTTNNTIYGTQFQKFPETEIPLVVDMTSELFSRDLDYNKFSIIFAAAQKNIGPAGVTLVVVKKSFLEKQKNQLPEIFSFRDLFHAHSTLNTPPVFAIYCSVLYLRWTLRMGMEAIFERNKKKASMLYQAIDESKIFYGTAKEATRSEMNICFRGQSVEQEEAFLDFARRNGIFGIKGHRSVGGFRAALYNAISIEDVAFLIKIIQRFEKEVS